MQPAYGQGYIRRQWLARPDGDLNVPISTTGKQSAVVYIGHVSYLPLRSSNQRTLSLCPVTAGIMDESMSNQMIKLAPMQQLAEVGLFHSSLILAHYFILSSYVALAEGP